MSSGGGQLRLLRAAADDVTLGPADVTTHPPPGTSETAPAGAEARMHLRVARFIMEAGVKLGLGSVPLATACAAYHRFAGAVGPGAPYDPHLVAAAALFLAGKAEGQPLRARDVLNVAHRAPQISPRAPPPAAPRPPGACTPGSPPRGSTGASGRCATAWCSASCCCCASCASVSPSPTRTSTCCTTCWRWDTGAGGGAGGTRGCQGRPGRCCGTGRRGGWGCGTPPSTWPPPPSTWAWPCAAARPPPAPPPVGGRRSAPRWGRRSWSRSCGSCWSSTASTPRWGASPRRPRCPPAPRPDAGAQ
ncbi:cyclin-Q isoform X2 [Struthio camelus]|uniref:cyclin-Q isoform X2 n=1 Tax=Struthio camelus TaxID=8801 RepID=UPI0036042AF6